MAFRASCCSSVFFSSYIVKGSVYTAGLRGDVESIVCYAPPGHKRKKKLRSGHTQRDRENESVYAFRDDQESLEKKRVDIRPPSVCQDSRGIRRIGRQETKEMRRSDSMMRHFQRATVAFHNDATERSSLFLLYPIRSYSTSRST